MFLSITAIVAVCCLIGGEFGETQLKILATTFAISAASICAMSCAAFLEKHRQRFFGLTGMVFAVLAGGMSLLMIWAGIDSAGFWKTTGVFIVISVAFAHALLLQMPMLNVQYKWTQKISVFLIAALALEIINAICTENDHDTLWRVIGVTSILVVLITLVIPICSKLGGNQNESLDKLVLERLSDDTYVDKSGQKFRVTAIQKD